MKITRTPLSIPIAVLAALFAIFLISREAAPPATALLHVSFDPTRELLADINTAFVRRREGASADAPAAGAPAPIDIRQSHGGSGKQARAVIDGLEADVVSLALAHDIDTISESSGRISADWRDKFPHGASPMTSTVVFIVREGNPKGIKDWSDLARPGVQLVFPNPKTSGGARWSYLAAWGFAAEQATGDAAERDRGAAAFMERLLANVAVMDTGARSATNTFVQRGVGDALVGWESDARLVEEQFKDRKLELVYPSVSIVAEPCVAVVDRVADKHGTTDIAREYLAFLYTDEAQRIIAAHGFRPRSPVVASEYGGRFPAIRQFTLEERFGDWASVHQRHFAPEGTLDAAMAARAESTR
jgi:sulfate/thiosulfate-binding protein